MSEAPEPVQDLEGVLRVLRNAKAAISSQAEQIDQMSGMFDDEDGTIAGAVEDGEDAEAELEMAISHVESLIETARFERVEEERIDEAHADHLRRLSDDLAVSLARSRSAGIAPASAQRLHEVAHDILDRYVEDLANADEDDHVGRVEILGSEAESLVNLLVGAAIAADDHAHRRMPEIAIRIEGGVVQSVCVASDREPVLVYVQDGDVDEEDARDEGVARIVDDADPTSSHPAMLHVTSGDVIPSNGPRWTSLRAEAARLSDERTADEAAAGA